MRGSLAADRHGHGDLRDELARIFTGDLSYCRDKLLLPEAGRALLPAADLLRPAVLDGIIARFAAPYGEADRRAVISLWTQLYFSTLLIPAAAATLLLRRALPLRLCELAVALDRDTQRPLAFQLPGEGRPASPPDIRASLVTLAREHLEPLIAGIAGHSGLSRRLLWSNAAGYLEWIIRRLAEGPEMGAAATVGLALVEGGTWPDGSRNPLLGHAHLVIDNGETVSRRRICCLRYLLPGMQACGSLCPLPEGRERH